MGEAEQRKPLGKMTLADEVMVTLHAHNNQSLTHIDSRCLLSINIDQTAMVIQRYIEAGFISRTVISGSAIYSITTKGRNWYHAKTGFVYVEKKEGGPTKKRRERKMWARCKCGKPIKKTKAGECRDCYLKRVKTPKPDIGTKPPTPAHTTKKTKPAPKPKPIPELPPPAMDNDISKGEIRAVISRLSGLLVAARQEKRELCRQIEALQRRLDLVQEIIPSAELLVGVYTEMRPPLIK